MLLTRHTAGHCFTIKERKGAQRANAGNDHACGLQIATRVEIFTGNLPPGSRHPDSCTWKRLGFLSFDKNERSGYQARELKSVHVSATAYLLRLVVHTCHPNKLNTDNQVTHVLHHKTLCSVVCLMHLPPLAGDTQGNVVFSVKDSEGQRLFPLVCCACIQCTAYIWTIRKARTPLVGA